MLTTFFFLSGTLFLSLNFIRPLGIAISDWLYFGALISALFETFISKKHDLSPWFRPYFFWPALLIILGAIISLTNSNNIAVSIVELFQQIYVITIFLSLIYILVKRGKTELIIAVFIISGVFTSIIAVIDYFFNTRIGPLLSGTPQIQYWGRYAGTLGHPNKFGYFLVITIILTFYKLLRLKRKRNSKVVIIILIALMIQGMAIYLSGSITGYLGVIIGFLYLFYVIVPSKIQKVFNIFGLLFITAILLIIIIRINTTNSNQLGISKSSLIDQGISRVLNITAGERIDLYELSIDYILKSPLIGVGYDQISTSGISQEARLLSGSIHNPLLQIWYAGGLFAFLGWLIVNFSIGQIAVLNLLRQRKDQLLLNNALSAIIIAVLIMDQFQDSIYQREKWLVVGLLVGLNWKNKVK